MARRQRHCPAARDPCPTVRAGQKHNELEPAALTAGTRRSEQGAAPESEAAFKSLLRPGRRAERYPPESQFIPTAPGSRRRPRPAAAGSCPAHRAAVRSMLMLASSLCHLRRLAEWHWHKKDARNGTLKAPAAAAAAAVAAEWPGPPAARKATRASKLSESPTI
jgi:hypothetical protein